MARAARVTPARASTGRRPRSTGRTPFRNGRRCGRGVPVRSVSGSLVQPVVELAVEAVDLFARLAQRELAGITRGHPHVTAERLDRGALDAGGEHLGGG